MNHKLFIVCPFSQLEYFIRRQFGQDCFFISVPAGMIPQKDESFLANLKMSIFDNNISEVYLLSEVANPLVLSILTDEDPINEGDKKHISFMSPIIELMSEYWLERFVGLSQRQKALKMAELINEQSIEFLKYYLGLKKVELDRPVTIKGLIISKESGFIKELKKMSRYKIAYGL